MHLSCEENCFICHVLSGWLMSITCVLWCVPCSNMGLSKHGDPVFLHFCPLNQNLARVQTSGRKQVNKVLHTCTSWYTYAAMFGSSKASTADHRIGWVSYVQAVGQAGHEQRILDSYTPP